MMRQDRGRQQAQKAANPLPRRSHTLLDLFLESGLPLALSGKPILQLSLSAREIRDGSC